jgi:hypothetical protein
VPHSEALHRRYITALDGDRLKRQDEVLIWDNPVALRQRRAEIANRGGRAIHPIPGLRLSGRRLRASMRD